MIVNRRTALAFLAALLLAPLAANAANAKAADAPRYALVVYTFRTPGVCPACDRARPAAVRLANEYPIEFAYRDDPSGATLAGARNVTAFPTFTVVRRDAAGERAPGPGRGMVRTPSRPQTADMPREGRAPRPCARQRSPARPWPVRLWPPSTPRLRCAAGSRPCGCGAWPCRCACRRSLSACPCPRCRRCRRR